MRCMATVSPLMLVVTDINEDRLARARELFTEEDAAKQGVEADLCQHRQDMADPAA